MPKDQLLGTFEQMVLLAILHIGKEAYGPRILEKLAEGTGRIVSRGSLYVTLDRLERKEMLRSTIGEPERDRGGRPKRYVAVTEKGVAALREARDSLTALWAGLETDLGK
jgi:DNA-binding PadR family transcriptional regulator